MLLNGCVLVLMMMLNDDADDWDFKDTEELV
jgi:hypothetical protein